MAGMPKIRTWRAASGGGAGAAPGIVPRSEQRTPLALGLDRKAGRVLVRVLDWSERGLAARTDFAVLFRTHGRRVWRGGDRCWSVPAALRKQVCAWAALHYALDETTGWSEVAGEHEEDP